MAKKAQPGLSQMHLADWLEYFELGPTAAAKLAGCTQPYISNIMAGRRTSVNVLYLVRLTEEIGISVNDLYRPAPTRLQLAQLQNYSPQAQATILQRARKKS